MIVSTAAPCTTFRRFRRAGPRAVWMSNWWAMIPPQQMGLRSTTCDGRTIGSVTRPLAVGDHLLQLLDTVGRPEVRLRARGSPPSGARPSRDCRRRRGPRSSRRDTRCRAAAARRCRPPRATDRAPGAERQRLPPGVGDDVEVADVPRQRARVADVSTGPVGPKNVHVVAPPVGAATAPGGGGAGRAARPTKRSRSANSSAPLPVDPRRLVVLVVGVVVAALGAAELVAHRHHRHAVRHRQQAPRVAQLAAAQGERPPPGTSSSPSQPQFHERLSPAPSRLRWPLASLCLRS